MTLMARDAVTLERKKVAAKGRTYWYWVLRWVDPATGKRRSETIGRADDRRHDSFLTKTGAKELRDQKATEFSKTPSRRRLGITLAEWLELYRQRRQATGAKPGTLAVDARARALLLAHFAADIPIRHIQRIEPTDPATPTAQSWYQRLCTGELTAAITAAKWDAPRWSISSARKYLRNVRTMFNAAVEDGLIDGNPFTRLGTTESAADTTWRYVSIDDFHRLLNAAPRKWWPVLIMARMAALRRDDILALTWPQVDLGASRIRLWRSKVIRRAVRQEPPISAELRRYLDEWRAGRTLKLTGPDPVVDAGSLTFNNLGRETARWCRRAKIAAYGKPLHTLVKSCITDWVREHPAHVVQVWAGHATIETTLKYYTAAEDHQLADTRTRRRSGA